MQLERACKTEIPWLHKFTSISVRVKLFFYFWPSDPPCIRSSVFLIISPSALIMVFVRGVNNMHVARVFRGKLFPRVHFFCFIPGMRIERNCFYFWVLCRCHNPHLLISSFIPSIHYKMEGWMYRRSEGRRVGRSEGWKISFFTLLTVWPSNHLILSSYML